MTEGERMQRAAVLNAAAARVVARVAGMLSENLWRHHRGESLAWCEPAFEAIIRDEGIDWNYVCRMFSD